jgi:23S rRNA G2445 N2-methylase RlmL
LHPPYGERIGGIQKTEKMYADCVPFMKSARLEICRAFEATQLISAFFGKSEQ